MPRILAISAVTLAAGSTPPLPGLAPCDSLISNALTCVRQFLRPLRRKVAVPVADAVLGGADLHDDVAAALEMVGRQAALAGVHPAAGHGRAARQRAHRRRGNGAEAHAADVDDGLGLERLARVSLAYRERRRGQAVLLQHRVRRIDEKDGAGLVGVVGGAETDDAALGLGQPVYPGARGAIERQLLPVVHEEILAEVFPLFLEK